MRDLEFELGAVPQRYQDVVQRMAVLNRLRGIAGTPNDVRKHTYELIEQWRARIGALTNAGWIKKASNGMVTWAPLRNCLPTFTVTTGRPLRVCRHAVICPFCYARDVRENWLLVDADLQRTNKLQEPEIENMTEDTESETPEAFSSWESPYHWIERRHTFRRPTCIETNDIATVTSTLISLLKTTADSRSSFVSRINPVGAFVFVTVVPTDDCTEWEFVSRQLLKIRKDAMIPDDVVANTNGVVRRHTHPTRAVMVRAVARTWAYPVGMMTGNPIMTALLLNIRKSTRFRAAAAYRQFVKRQTFD